MGGYGACKAAFKRPDLYAAFASLSGALDIGGIADYIASGAEQRMFESVFGDPEAARGGPDDLTTIAGQAKQSAQKLPRAYFACGTLDRLCYPMNQRMLSCLNDLGIPYTYEEGPGMHNWEFWDTYIQRALDWMFPAER